MRCGEKELELTQCRLGAWGSSHNAILVHIKPHYAQLHFCTACVTVGDVNNTKIFEQPERIAGLAWGVHAPFRDYVQRMSDGQMTARDGAETLTTGETFFPLEASTSGELRFTGTLEFAGHHGMLAVVIQQPWLQQDAGQWQISIADPFGPGARMPCVVVDFDDAATGVTRLTEAGTDLFMGNYSENALFDPVRIVLAEQDAQS